MSANSKPLAERIEAYVHQKVGIQLFESEFSELGEKSGLSKSLLDSLFHAIQHFDIDAGGLSPDSQAYQVMTSKMLLIADAIGDRREEDTKSLLHDFFANPYTNENIEG